MDEQQKAMQRKIKKLHKALDMYHDLLNGDLRYHGLLQYVEKERMPFFAPKIREIEKHLKTI